MTTSWAELMQSIDILQPREVGELQVFGLRRQSDSRLVYRTLDDVLAAGLLDMTEVTECGSVSAIRVANRSPDMVFLLAGEHVIGAKQNRVLNASIMLAGRTTLSVPVSCVEAGRWHYSSATFASGGTLAHSALRGLLSRHACEGYRAAGSPISKQGEVWSEVSRKLTITGTTSVSSELQQAYLNHADLLTCALRRLPVPADASGAAFAVRGRVAGIDFFDQPGTLSRLWPKLVRSYLLDTLEPSAHSAPPMSTTGVRRWLHGASLAKAETYQSSGLGQDTRLEGERLVGAALVVEGQPVHVQLFATELN
jgi:hypothetical protein